MQRKTATLQFLGTGASNGIPVIGCKCHTCLSLETKNRRLRTSARIIIDGRNYLIDAGPDFRMQALAYQIERIDGVILTHTHYDHIGGLEELRIYNFLQKKAIPCSLSQDSLQDVRSLYHYHFKEQGDGKNFTAKFDFQPLAHNAGTAEVDGLAFSYTTYRQGEMAVLGLRFGDLAYLTDIKTYDHSIFEFLRGIKILIVSALRFTPSALHFTIDEAVEFAKKVGAEETYFIHISHEVEAIHAQSLLPVGIFLANDGKKVDFMMDKFTMDTHEH